MGVNQARYDRWEQEQQLRLSECKALVGNQPTWALRNMVRALNMMPWLNGEAEWQRLEAAKVVLASRKGR